MESKDQSDAGSQITDQQKPGEVPDGADSDAVTTLDADLIA